MELLLAARQIVQVANDLRGERPTAARAAPSDSANPKAPILPPHRNHPPSKVQM